MCKTFFHIIDNAIVGIHNSNSGFIYELPSLFVHPDICSKSLILHIYRYYAAAIPSILNVFSGQSYLVLNSIIGGQALAAVSNKLNDTLGIVIIALISFSVGF